jgi:chromate transport protein ChrA
MAAGLLIGLVLGWVFHKTVGFILTLLFVTPFIVLAVLAVMYWRRTSTESRAATRDAWVTDADWQEVDPKRRTR